ncbi:glycosyltransferase [Senegalimassilia anaerobia]|uniref:glycosyltransferase n=1 Tax=Senegalimassilia anaerobia TaxID=1473216 RepID=UPI003AB9A9E4
MRFCFVFDGLGCGGIERVGIDYCNALVERGHGVTVVNLVPSKNEFASQLSDKVVYVTRRFPRRLAPECYCTLVKRAAWGRFAYPAVFAACSAAVAVERPLLKRGLGSFDVAIAFSGHYNDLTFVSCGCVRAAKKLAWLHGGLPGYALTSDGYLNLYKHFDGLVTLCDDGIEEFEHANWFLNYTFRKIYNPISIKPAEVDGNDVERLRGEYGSFALMVARLDYPHKDPFTAIGAVKKINEKYGLGLNLVIVGDGPDRQRVEEFVAEQGMGGKAFLAGYQSDPAPYYAASRLVVHASAGAEGLPTVMLEGMAFGKPIVATDVRTGPKEILGYNEYGLLCRAKDSDDMARQIAKILDDEALYRHYASKATERVQDFSEDKAIDGLLGYVSDLMGEKVTSGR